MQIPALLAAVLLSATGEPVDLASFGTPLPGEGFAGVEWENPREVSEVRAVFPDGAPPPPAGSLRLEWWGSVWPANGTGGWMKLDDPWNGQWVAAAAKASPVAGASAVSFAFPPLSKAEWKEAGKDPGPVFRRTLKVRVVAAAGAPAPRAISAFGRSTWREGSFDIELRHAGDGARAARIDVTNGRAAGIASLPAPRTAKLGGNVKPEGASWTSSGPAGSAAGVRVRLLFAESPDPDSNDLTRVTVRLGADPAAAGFSFVPQDVLAEGAIRLPDLGALVSETSRGITMANDPGPSRAWERTVRGRVAGRPEMTRDAAMAGIPRLSPARWVPLGVPAARQEPQVGPLGDWSMSRESLHTPGRDSARMPFRGKTLDCIIDTRDSPLFDGRDRESLVRRLEEDRLPVIHVEWRSGPIAFHETLLATVLAGDLGGDDPRRGDEARRGDETVVLLARLEVANRADRPATARLNLRWSHGAPISLEEDGVVAITSPAPAGLTALRAKVDGGRRGEWSVVPSRSADFTFLRWEAALAPGESRSVEVAEPFVDLLDPAELARLRALRFVDEYPRVAGWWRKRLSAGMEIHTPCAPLDAFVDAALWHVLISTDRDPGTGLFNGNVGTFGYKVFANETVMIARSLDMRGEGREAERLLEPMIRYQGSEALTGRFSTKDGVFHGAGEYTHGQYAMNHGFTLWGIADHYLLGRDRAYLERVAPALLKGCDFLISERKSTLSPAGGPRSPVHGLAPASSLEDVVEFQYWFATNSYFHLGLKRAGEALAAAGHPDSARVLREAEAYRADIERAAREAATRAAAVRLRDGRWVPYVPSRAGAWRHLTEGWIREALYPSLHLATGEVVAPEDPLVTWLLDDLEDNIFFSAESGYGVRDADARWFERGAVTLQPCLLDTPALYLARDEVPAALRAFWNTYALLIYPDATCFAEWAKAFGTGGGPVYKTSDECRFVLWLRQLLVWEDGDRLWFARGAPREWLEDGKEVRVERAATLFGPAGLRIRSQAASGKIEASLVLPARNPPSEVWLRLRHPQGKTPARVTVAGGAAEARVMGEDIGFVRGEAPLPAAIDLTAEYDR